MSARIIASRYRLLREVGRGGTATVYLAADDKHHREVALKVLRADLAAAVGSARFLREIEITAGLNHPHILPLLDSGDEAGLLYYVMPYVAGGSLRLLLSQEIPLEAAVRIVREVASALDHAHARGVIHRDVKPENILFNDGLAVVSDFGIARAVGEASMTRMTGTGLSVGTLGYMSPEQALGSQELDARTDVYGLASVAYEMLVGQTPSSWPSAEDVELGRFSDLPDAHRARLDGLPGRVEQVLARGLALRPQHRYASPGQLASELATAAEATTRFTDEQVRWLLERAADLQQDEPDGAALTIGAVEQIAAQVGIPPGHVREAAKELEQSRSGVDVVTGPAGSRPERVAPFDWRRLRRDRWNRLVVEESVEENVPESAHPAMAAEIERRLGIPGHASSMGGTLTWTPAAQTESTRKIVIQVASGEGRTDVRIQEDLEVHGPSQFITIMGGLLGMGLSLAIIPMLGLGGPMIGIVLLGGAGGGVFAATRAVVNWDATDRAPELQDLARSLAETGRTTPGPAVRADVEPEDGP